MGKRAMILFMVVQVMTLLEVKKVLAPYMANLGNDLIKGGGGDDGYGDGEMTP